MLTRAVSKAVLARVRSLAATSLLMYSAPSHALSELFSTYDSPQALMMGNASTADSRWYTALFQNPAGLAQAYRRDTRRHWSTTPFALDWMPSANMLGQVISSKTMNFARVVQTAQGDPGGYYYSRLNLVPSITHRNFGLALLGTSEFVARSDGTNVDIRSGNDVGVVVGLASNFFGNTVKLGINGKAIVRNQISGTFAHTTLADTASIAANSAEGIGYGFDVGLLMTAPLLWLPTIGVSVRDALGTKFSPSRILNTANNGQAPASIQQSINVGFMMSPILWKGTRANFTADLKYVDRPDIPLSKKLHFGLEMVTDKRFYLWLGANQLILPCLGIGLRTVGGDLELGSYAQDVGDGATRESSRRIAFRYTVGW